MEKINEYCSFSSEKGNWNFLKKIITYENQLFPITNDSIKNLRDINLSENEDISVINNNQLIIDEEISESLLLYVLTWNIHGKFPEGEEIRKILPKKTKENSCDNSYQKSRYFDLYVINTQECLRSIGASFFNSSKEDWVNALKDYLGDDYINLVNSNLNSFHIAVFVKKEKINYFTELKTGFIKTGFMNILANKGAIGVSMKYQNKTLLFVCCHLSSGQDRIDARNSDFKKISLGLNLKPTSKFNRNLDNIKLGLNNREIYNSNCCPGEIVGNNNKNFFEEEKKIKVISEIQDIEEKEDFKKIGIRKSSLALPHSKDIDIVNIDDKLLKTKTIINQKKLSFFYNNKNNENNNESQSGSDINSNINRIDISKKVKNNLNFSPQKRITPIKPIITKSTNELINSDNINSNYKKSPHNPEYLIAKGDTKSTNAVTKMISSNIDEQNLKIKTELSCDLDLEPYSGMNQYDLVIFSGDLNYRINMDKEEVKKLISNNDVETLLEKDQLYSAINKREIDLDDFYEGRINFMPTYKFLDGTNEYDYAERVPGWTDRILYRANNLSDIILCKYSSIADVKTSDHKPVFAIFKINFNHEKNKKKYKDIEKGCNIV
jgi:hypothetical protein